MAVTKRMNVCLYLAPAVTRSADAYEFQPAITNRLSFGDEESILWEGGRDQVVADVRFLTELVNGREVRVLEITNEREGMDLTLPTLVVCASGRKAWCGSDVDLELGQSGNHYAALCILKPGIKPYITDAEPVVSPHDGKKYLPPSNMGAIILGSWLQKVRINLAAGERPMLTVITAPFDSVLGSPSWENAESDEESGSSREDRESETVYS